MLFQTPEFALLMLCVILGIILFRTSTLQLLLLVLASWYFYMSWNPVFIFLLLLTTTNDFVAGLQIAKATTSRSRTGWLILSCCVDLGVLGFFKYYNFFVDSVNQVLVWGGGDSALPVLNITLPVGISFYTFHTLGYTIDVFRGKTKAERSYLRFALYVAFYPQLVAGPILRSAQFLPQLQEPTNIREDNLRSGFHLFLVGLVKKVLIADHVAPLANAVFDSPQGMPSALIWLGTFAFGIQIYCDFSGYTDMARGAARILGLEIPVNFNYPYFSCCITDFWRRWHISLSSWLRDYLYISLGGNRKGTVNTYRNLLLTMGLGGLWHGASWNFVFWGIYQGVLLCAERLLGIGGKTLSDMDAAKRSKSLIWKCGGWFLTQYFVFYGWLLFRVHGWDDIVYCSRKYILFDFDRHVAAFGLGNASPFFASAMMVLFIVLHAASYRVGGFANRLDRMGWKMRLPVYAAAFLALISMWPASRTAFIYFQF